MPKCDNCKKEVLTAINSEAQAYGTGQTINKSTLCESCYKKSIRAAWITVLLVLIYCAAFFYLTIWGPFKLTAVSYTIIFIVGIIVIVFINKLLRRP